MFEYPTSTVVLTAVLRHNSISACDGAAAKDAADYSAESSGEIFWRRALFDGVAAWLAETETRVENGTPELLGGGAGIEAAFPLACVGVRF